MTLVYDVTPLRQRSHSLPVHVAGHNVAKPELHQVRNLDLLSFLVLGITNNMHNHARTGMNLLQRMDESASASSSSAMGSATGCQ